MTTTADPVDRRGLICAFCASVDLSPGHGVFECAVAGTTLALPFCDSCGRRLFAGEQLEARLEQWGGDGFGATVTVTEFKVQAEAPH